MKMEKQRRGMGQRQPDVLRIGQREFNKQNNDLVESSSRLTVNNVFSGFGQSIFSFLSTLGVRAFDGFCAYSLIDTTLDALSTLFFCRY